MHTLSTSTAMHVLVADDNDANCLIVRTLLERAGHSVVTVQNGCQALNITKHDTYDLIILDIMMPVMDGVSAMQKIRQEESENKNTLIFALTAYSDPEDRKRYSSAGFDAFLSKPLRNGDLERALQSFEDQTVRHSENADEEGSSQQVQILDKDTLQLLINHGRPERLLEIQSRFWASIHTQCNTIKTCLPAVLEGDMHSLSEFRRAVHAVKGASASIGLARVADISRQLRNAHQTNIPGLMRSFIEALSESRPALKQALSGTRKFNPTIEMRREDKTEAAHHGQYDRSAIGN